MKFLRHLLGITKLDREKNQCNRPKNGSTEYSKRNKTVPEKWLQHVQRMDTDYQNKHYNINQKTKEHRTTEEEMESSKPCTLGL